MGGRTPPDQHRTMENIMLRILSYLMAATPLMPTRQRGATLIEYVLIVAVIAVAVLVGADSFGLSTAISDLFTEVTGEL